MASLGWRDTGQVLLSKNEAFRLESEQRDLTENGPRQNSAMAVMSRRKQKKQHVDEDRMRDKEAAAEFPTDLVEVLARKPESRMKWLQKGLVLAGKKVVAVTTIYNIATNKKFVAGITDSQGSRMKATLLANLHLFSAKQQKYLESEASNFHSFEMPGAKRRSRSAKARSRSPKARSRSGKAAARSRSPKARSRSPRARSRSPKKRSRSPKASRRKQREEAQSSSPEASSAVHSRKKPLDRSNERRRSSPEASPPGSRAKQRDKTRSRSRKRSHSGDRSNSEKCQEPSQNEKRARGADRRRRRSEGSDSEGRKSPPAKDGGIVASWLQRQRLPEPAPLQTKSVQQEDPDDDDRRINMPGAADDFL